MSPYEYDTPEPSRLSVSVASERTSTDTRKPCSVSLRTITRPVRPVAPTTSTSGTYSSSSVDVSRSSSGVYSVGAPPISPSHSAPSPPPPSCARTAWTGARAQLGAGRRGAQFGVRQSALAVGTSANIAAKGSGEEQGLHLDLHDLAAGSSTARLPRASSASCSAVDAVALRRWHAHEQRICAHLRTRDRPQGWPVPPAAQPAVAQLAAARTPRSSASSPPRRRCSGRSG